MKAFILAVSLSISVVPGIACAQPLPAELAALGITAGMPFSKAKRLLDAAGWQASPPRDAPEVLDGFPEVGCQKGGNNCSSTFAKDGQQVALQVGTTLAGQPFVQGVR
ncbi:hypothetical protein CR920_11285 [Stenotrophomonas indicatrix]|uniref:hypothetical protein n=1 Tax=Stenotrophomonas indicatrix TaxID=2045451 RepID=UPI000C194789|nr:hypothetical protein [Stenotrophomonas indicatrix]PII16334.1 hypothetical protein CR920_11285 [Stenotrophomonas indicatrix]